MKFLGYKRPDGRVGIRNHVLILSTVGCAAEVARQVAEGLNGAVSFINQNGCGETEKNLKRTRDVLVGMIANPNVYGAIAIGLGCEINQMGDFLKLVRERTNKPVEYLLIQEEGGSINTIAKATRLAQRMIIEASTCKREECDISNLILGVECGGSDATSGLVANPVMGLVSDKLIAMGATSMFSETVEMIGAEHLLAKRAVTPELGQRILQIVHAREEEQIAVGEDIRKTQPSPGNRAGGITTLEEKSLGCIHKGGHTPVMEFVDYAQEPTKKGLVLMDTPCYDLVSVTAKAAGGCQLIVFTTGRGNTVGNPVVPVMKVTANGMTYRHMEDNHDMDLSGVLDGKLSLEEQADIVLAEILRILEGKMTKAEVLKFGYSETVISRACEYC